MKRARFAWALLALPFLGYYALLVYCDVVRPENPGMEYKRGDLVIDKVTPGSPADRAGLAVGDDVVAIDGHLIYNRLDIDARGQNLEFNRPQDFMVVRPLGTTHLQLTVGPARPGYLWKQEEFVLLGLRAMLLVTLLLGVFLAWKRPADVTALLAAGLLSSAGVLSIAMPYRMATVWRGLPAVIGVPLWLPFFSTAAVGAWLFVFCLMFPERRRWPWAVWVVTLVPILAAVAGFGVEAVRTVYRPDDLTGVSLWRYRGLLYTNVAYVAAGLVTLVVRYRGLSDANARRRVRVLVFGSLIGWVAGTPVVVAYYLGDADSTHSIFGSNAMSIGAIFFLVFPMSFAYAVMRHRLFDISVIVRMGVRYALARRALLSIVPAIGLALALDVLLHGQEKLVDILRLRGGIYLVIGAAAIVAHTQRRGWLDALDRRFFRERYDARQLLGRLVAETRRVGRFELMAPRAVAEIEAALHPAFAAIFVRQPHEPVYRAVAVAPAGHALPPLPAAMACLQVVRVLNKPLDVGLGETGVLQAQLPDSDRDLLRDAQIDLIVPIVVGEQRTEALLALGIKRSEEPYTQEDLELLSASAESLALLVERPEASIAPADQLAGRYRLERRLGSGGMGTVYAAVDTALDRPVAVKVIRDELVGRAEAAARFQQEARVAARFAHPNVVTVHDFGVTPANVGYLVMELLDGVTLRAELRAQGPIETPRALALMRDVVSAVDAAHRQHLIHRDLKPENIFLVRADARDVAKVLDFGIAKSVSPSAESPAFGETQPGTILGTPPYMAPEQLRGEDPQPSWDLWALGVVAYEMVTGQHPFAGTSAGVARAGSAGYDALIGAHLGSAPASCRAFFTRALAIDPAKRPSTARELLVEFEHAVSSADGR